MTLVLTIDEVAEMLGSWHEHALEEFHSAEDRKKAIMGYIEHMRAGDFEVGREVGQQVYVNEKRTVLARLWGNGRGEVTTRDDSSAIWEPPTTVRLVR